MFVHREVTSFAHWLIFSLRGKTKSYLPTKRTWSMLPAQVTGSNCYSPDHVQTRPFFPPTGVVYHKGLFFFFFFWFTQSQSVMLQVVCLQPCWSDSVCHHLNWTVCPLACVRSQCPLRRVLAGFCAGLEWQTTWSWSRSLSPLEYCWSSLSHGQTAFLRSGAQNACIYINSVTFGSLF